MGERSWSTTTRSTSRRLDLGGELVHLARADEGRRFRGFAALDHAVHDLRARAVGEDRQFLHGVFGVEVGDVGAACAAAGHTAPYVDTEQDRFFTRSRRQCKSLLLMSCYSPGVSGMDGAGGCDAVTPAGGGIECECGGLEITTVEIACLNMSCS